MWWRKKKPKARIEPYLSPPKAFELTDEEVMVLVKLSKCKFPIDEGMVEWIIDHTDGRNFEGKFNYFLAAMSACLKAELTEREVNRIINVNPACQN